MCSDVVLQTVVEAVEELVSEQLDRSRAYDIYKQVFDDLWHDVSGSIVRSSSLSPHDPTQSLELER